MENLGDTHIGERINFIVMHIIPDENTRHVVSMMLAKRMYAIRSTYPCY